MLPANGLDLPELSGRAEQIIRIPNEADVVVTPRIRSLLDARPMQRLKQISQLGLVSQVYPGAVHSRFEHSLGVYRLGRQVLLHLSATQPELTKAFTSDQVKTFLLATLLHDVGHWPYCHPIEDIGLPWIPRHEVAARSLITEADIAAIIEEQWSLPATQVADFLSLPATTGPASVLQNILNGPVDIDKMDYLHRDSLHAGVPYGRNFDGTRLLNSLRIGKDDRIEITEKGKTAAEMMVFARYVMFSEVYWHHSVRSATAMLQRLVFRLQDGLRSINWLNTSDRDFQDLLLETSSASTTLHSIAQGLFGRERRLYKRFAQYNFSEGPEVHAALARRPFEALVRCSDRLAQKLSEQSGIQVMPDDVLIDAPPVKLEVQFNLNVRTRQGSVPLAAISPVVRSLATDQFDNFVKQVRIFIAPHLRNQVRVERGLLTTWLLDSLND